MKTFYFIDFENVHNEGLEGIDSLTKDDHVHIFSTENALNIIIDVICLKEVEVKGHIVPVRNQSLDMHLVSYLGHLLAIHGKQCSYVIVSKDKDYDNIIKFWQGEGYKNISRKQKIAGNITTQKKTSSQSESVAQTVNSKTGSGVAYDFTGDDRSELNEFMQHELLNMGYSSNVANRVCKYVVKHCNDASRLSLIHNDLKREYDECSEIYKDVKSILNKFPTPKSKMTERESRVRSFFGQHFRKKIYVDNKEEIISIILNAQTKQQVNNGLLKLYSDGDVVKYIYKTVKTLIEDLPGK